jgi:hypothetical protein
MWTPRKAYIGIACVAPNLHREQCLRPVDGEARITICPDLEVPFPHQCIWLTSGLSLAFFGSKRLMSVGRRDKAVADGRVTPQEVAALVVELRPLSRR